MLLQICTEFFVLFSDSQVPWSFYLDLSHFWASFIFFVFSQTPIYSWWFYYIFFHNTLHFFIYFVWVIGKETAFPSEKQNRTRHPKQTKTTQTPEVNSSFLSNFWFNNCVVYIHQLEKGVKAYLCPYHHYSLNSSHKPDPSVPIVSLLLILVHCPSPFCMVFLNCELCEDLSSSTWTFKEVWIFWDYTGENRILRFSPFSSPFQFFSISIEL